MRCLRYVLITVICMGMLFGSVFAQDKETLSVGTLRGQITDLTPAQNPIEGVEVKIIAQDGGKEFITKTDAEGNYKHALLPTGRYMISISKDGYDSRAGKPVTIVKGGDHFVPLKMTQKGNQIQPFFKAQWDERMNIIVKQRIVSVLERVAESVGTRYDLDEVVVKALHQSILDSIERASKQGDDLRIFAKPMEEGNMSLLEMLLSHPVCQAAFAKHLSEAQFKDYLEFTEARQQRDRQAVVQRITTILDKELSLRTEQRDKVVQLLLDTADKALFPNAMNALWFSPQQAAQLMHYRLNVRLDGVLSEAQSKVWQGLVNANTNVDIFIVAPEVGIKEVIEVERIDEEEIADPNKKRMFIRREPVKPVKTKQAAKIVINEVMIDPPGKLQPWIEVNPDTDKSPEHKMEIAEAKLKAHTELLGSFNERAARRLALVTKGVAQESIEAQDKDHEAMDELWGDGGSKIEITDHPMYQQTIKDVLSEEAFARYRAHQAERASLHQQVLRDIVVACVDTQLLLDDSQRERVETAASRLIPAPIGEKGSSTVMFFQLFPQTVDFEVLTPWQRGEFERVFGPLARRKR